MTAIVSFGQLGKSGRAESIEMRGPRTSDVWSGSELTSASGSKWNLEFGLIGRHAIHTHLLQFGHAECS